MAAGAEWDARITEEERPTRQLGGDGLAALDVARGGTGGGWAIVEAGLTAWQPGVAPFELKASKTMRVASLQL